MAHAQVPCTGTITGTVPDNVMIDGIPCTINGATITGSVEIINGGSLTTTGATQIFGSVLSTSSGDINLQGTTSVSGDVSSETSPSSVVQVGPDAVLGQVSLLNSGSVDVEGTVLSVLNENSGAVAVTGGTIGGISAKLGSGDIILCDATITGSIEIVERTGDLSAEESPSCPMSSITAGVLVEKGTGDVKLIGANFTSGDLSVVEQTGDIVITSALLSDISISDLTGSVALTMIEADSDVGIGGISGSVSLTGSTVTGDVGIEESGAVSIISSKFANQSVSVKGNSGPVEVSSNSELSIEIIENMGVTVSDNDVGVASISVNTGGVSITGNTFVELGCVDNMPAPSGADNTVTLTSSGQCAGF
ncbi:filamentous hemagglutinin [Gracilaria domingensis]|nr:filamentous hemagglutinin [Gracilaria domingensis]